MANPNLSFNSELHCDSHSQIELDILKERLQQAHDSFTLARLMTGAFGVISLFGAVLLLFGKVPAGTLTTVGGLASTIGCHQLAKDANDRLDKISSELHKDNETKHTLP
jgi:hypothetical protein